MQDTYEKLAAMMKLVGLDGPSPFEVVGVDRRLGLIPRSGPYNKELADSIVRLSTFLHGNGYSELLVEKATNDIDMSFAISLLDDGLSSESIADKLGKASPEMWRMACHILANIKGFLFGHTPDYFHSRIGYCIPPGMTIEEKQSAEWCLLERAVKAMLGEKVKLSIFKKWLFYRCKNIEQYKYLTVNDVLLILRDYAGPIRKDSMEQKLIEMLKSIPVENKIACEALSLAVDLFINGIGKDSALSSETFGDQARLYWFFVKEELGR